MKKQKNPVIVSIGKSTIEINSKDSLCWKMSMLLEASYNKELTVEEIASKYGYTREYFYQTLYKFREKGSKGLADKPTGPKKNYTRTDEIKKQIIRLRFLDPESNCEVITQKLKQMDYNISQRSVERTVGEYGLQKKSYIKQIRKKNSILLKPRKPNVP